MLPMHPRTQYTYPGNGKGGPELSEVSAAVLLALDALEDARGALDNLGRGSVAELLPTYKALKTMGTLIREEFLPAVENALGASMGQFSMIVDGYGQLKRHRRKDRSAWDKEELLEAVRDSRLIDHQTGEVADESPLDKVLHVWNLPAPRVTALRDRDIDPDQFCTSVEQEGFTIELRGPSK